MSKSNLVAELEGSVFPKEFNVDYRLDSFTRCNRNTPKWPHSDVDECNVAALSEAGFIRVPNTKDTVRCFVCDKTLEGWESTDNPWQEHKDHSGDCPFVNLRKKDYREFTIREFLKLTQYKLLKLNQVSFNPDSLKNKNFQETDQQIEDKFQRAVEVIDDQILEIRDSLKNSQDK